MMGMLLGLLLLLATVADAGMFRRPGEALFTADQQRYLESLPVGLWVRLPVALGDGCNVCECSFLKVSEDEVATDGLCRCTAHDCHGFPGFRLRFK